MRRYTTSLPLADGTSKDLGTNAGGIWDYKAGTIFVVSIPAEKPARRQPTRHPVEGPRPFPERAAVEP